MTSSGGATLYSRVKTSHPNSPWESSSIRASRRRRISGGANCAFEPRMADSRVAVKLWRYNVFAGRSKESLSVSIALQS